MRAFPHGKDFKYICPDKLWIGAGSQDSALSCLCEVKSPLTSNIMRLFVEATQHLGGWEDRLNMVRMELKQRGDPAYSPAAYLPLQGDQANKFRVVVQQANRKEKARIYQEVMSKAREVPRSDPKRFLSYCYLLRHFPTTEAFGLVADRFVSYSQLGAGDYGSFIYSLASIGAGLGWSQTREALAKVGVHWKSAPSEIARESKQNKRKTPS